MILWVALALMTAAAAGLVIAPLIRRSARVLPRAAYDREVYRDQLQEIERDVERGLIGDVEAEAARTEIGRRLLAAEDAAAAGGADRAESALDPETSPDPSATRSRTLPIAGGVVGVAAALALYVTIGAPGLPSKPAADRVQTATGLENLTGEQLVDELARRLLERPNDLRGWTLLAGAQARLGRFQDAAASYAKARALDPTDANLVSSYGEALAAGAGGRITDQAIQAFRDANKLNPEEPRARYYIGLYALQQGRAAEALRAWRQLLAESPPEAPWVPVVRQRIGQVIERAGGTPPSAAAPSAEAPSSGTSASPPGPTSEDIAAAHQMSADDRQAMIRSMVARLEDRLKDEPNDVDGWLRLGRSWGVLGDRAKARDALAKAAELKPDDPAVLAQYALATLRAADGTRPVPPAFEAIIEKILKLDPGNSNALFLSGLAAVRGGDADRARQRWGELLSRLKPGSPAHADLQRRIEALPK